MALAALVLLAGCKKQSSEKRITKFAFTSLNVAAAMLRQPYNPNAVGGRAVTPWQPQGIRWFSIINPYFRKGKAKQKTSGFSEKVAMSPNLCAFCGIQ